jgi:hypothetical protein
MLNFMKNKLVKCFWRGIFIISVCILSPVRKASTDLFETKPISNKTLVILKNNEEYFTYYSERYLVPKLALKAAVGSEINRRILIQQVADYFQDIFFSSYVCSEWLLKYSLTLGIKNSYLNISAQDIGLGNIKFLTAVEIVDKNKNEFPSIKTNKDLVNYLLTERGNIHIASLVIKEGVDYFRPYYTNCDDITKSAILYSHYKEGKSFYYRYLSNSKLLRPPIPDPNGLEIIKKLNTTAPIQ